MKKCVPILALVLLSCLLLGRSAFALSIGGYIEGGGGTAKAEHPNGNGSVDDSQVDSYSFGAGFTLDTAVRGPKLFNYRLHVGFEGQDFYDDEDRYVLLGGVVVDNTFGFALVRTDRFRLWLGPTLRLGYYAGHMYNEDHWNNNNNNNGHHYDDDDDDDEVGDYRAFAVGVGLVLGANFTVGRSFSVCPTIGYRYVKHYGSWSTDDSYGDRDGDARGWTSMGYAGVDFLFDLP